jgi:hypothetical protein
MSTLLEALQTKDTFTENGMATNSTSLNSCVDLFFQIGAMRGQDKNRLINSFTKAYAEDALTAMKLLFWARDIRGGAGERQIFRDIVTYLATHRTESLGKNLHLISEYGRFDDLLTLIGTPLESEALRLIKEALDANNGLAAKWMPRPNGSNKAVANVIRKYLGLSPKDYRQMLASKSNTVEQLMCSKEWEKIEYSKLPSKAMSDYMKAFSRNDLERFGNYIKALEKGEVKINAGAVYPYDIIKNLKHGHTQGANAQWLALPNYMEGSNELVLPLVDVSASMNQIVKDNPNLNVMDVAISLGLYICERNIGPFKDAFLTFTTDSQLQVVGGSLSERYNQMKDADWDGSTSIESAYRLLLSKAKEFNVPESQMPSMLLILSDMQFNAADEDYNVTAQELAEQMYAEAGYKLPKIVYWNLAARSGDTPVKFDKTGTALVSGFSPSLLKSILVGDNITPIGMMLSVVNSDRYEAIRA